MKFPHLEYINRIVRHQNEVLAFTKTIRDMCTYLNSAQRMHSVLSTPNYTEKIVELREEDLFGAKEYRDFTRFDFTRISKVLQPPPEEKPRIGFRPPPKKL